MRFVFIGAGAVGGTIGGRLFESGHDVVLVARGRHLDAIREEGLLLRTPDGDVTLPVPAVGGPDELALRPGDVLVSAVKSQDTQAVLEQWADVPVEGSDASAGDALPFLVAQNGVSNEREALRFFQRVYGMCLWLPATYLEPGVVSAEGHPLSGMLALGRFPSGLDDVSAEVAAALRRSRYAVFEEEDAMRWKHGKLISNLENGLEAAVGRLAGLDDVLAAVRAEGWAVLDAAGIAYSTPAEEDERRRDRVQVRATAGAERGGSSTWQSLARGTGGVEVDYLNGEIVLLGRLHGVPTPLNDALQLAVRQAARQGRGPGAFGVDALRSLLP